MRLRHLLVAVLEADDAFIVAAGLAVNRHFDYCHAPTNTPSRSGEAAANPSVSIPGQEGDPDVAGRAKKQRTGDFRRGMAAESPTLLTIERYRQEVLQLTADVDSEIRLSALKLIAELNRCAPAGIPRFTKAKINYLHKQGLLRPEVVGKGSLRRSWRYGREDVRHALLIEFLKRRLDLSVAEARGWLGRLEQTPLRVDSSSDDAALPTPASLTYVLLRSRTLGSILVALGQRDNRHTPAGCIIAVRYSGTLAEGSYARVTSWEEVKDVLGSSSWHIAVSRAHSKVYLRRELTEVLVHESELARDFSHYHWYASTFSGTDPDVIYETVLGLPSGSRDQQSVDAIKQRLDRQVHTELGFKLSDFPGFELVFDTAFRREPQAWNGPALSALTQIVASCTTCWTYSAILTPEVSDDGSIKQLRVREHSAHFPRHLLNRSVEVGHLLSGWSYRYAQPLVVEPTVDADPRIAFYTEEQPAAAAAVPAIARAPGEEERILGVLYVGRARSDQTRSDGINDDALAALKVFGYICGELLARDGVEGGTIQNIVNLSARSASPITVYGNLTGLLTSLSTVLRKGVSPQDAPHSWIYLLTLTVQTPSRSDQVFARVTKWIAQQAAQVTSEFLAGQPWTSGLRPGPAIGRCDVSSSRFVFAILDIVDVPESVYKAWLVELRAELGRMQLRGLITEFCPWGVTFRYEQLRRYIAEATDRSLVEHLQGVTMGALDAGPYIARGHDALRKPDLDQAIAAFEDAVRYAPDNWYVYKHLAEARFLQGNLLASMKQCGSALELNHDYASAHCLLADCLFYGGDHAAALAEYEKALELNNARPDFYTRYGIALSCTPLDVYRDVTSKHRSEDGGRRVNPKPYLEAMNQFQKAKELLDSSSDTLEERRKHEADYRYHRGCSYLNAGLLDKACEEFDVARRIQPGDLRIAQACANASALLRGRGEPYTSLRGQSRDLSVRQ